MDGKDGAYGLYGTLVGQGWDGPTLVGAGTGAPQLALGERWDVGIGVWHQLGWCCKGVDYLCQRSKIKQT